MARDLFEEAGIIGGAQSAGGEQGVARDLFAEAGITEQPASKTRSFVDIVRGGIDAVVGDVRQGLAHQARGERDALIAGANQAARREIELQGRSGTATELDAQATADAANRRHAGSPAQVVARGVDFGRDLAVSGAQGVIGLGESAVGLGNLATGWSGYTPGQALQDVVGYDPAAAKRDLAALKSDAGQSRDAAFEGTQGFTDTLLTLGTNPAMLSDKIAESLAGTVGAGAIGGKVVQLALPRVTAAAQAAGLTGAAAEAFIADRVAQIAIAAAAGGEGLQQAGNLAETARQGGREWRDYALPAVASGIGTAVIAAGSGGVARRMGVGDIEADIATRGTRSAVGTAPASWLNRVGIEGLKEGLIEEMPQSMQEAAWENVAMGRPWDQGLGKAAATGLATGMGMGAGHAATTRTSGDVSPPTASAPTDAVAASEVLEPVDAKPAPTAAERALYEPKALTALDRVAEIDRRMTEADLAPETAATLQDERKRLTADWPRFAAGASARFSTEAGARLDGQYALAEAGALTTSHDENLRPVPTYPTELQPRERERHASEMQIQQIVQRLDPARLGESADVATGAPIVGADGLVESGNARTIALKRIYQANGQKALDYRQFLKDNAERFGIAPESVDAMQKPVLVRLRQTPVNRAEFARQANQATVARMSPSEQARADAAMIDSLDDLNPDDNGDFMSGNSRGFVRRFLSRLPATEQAGLIDASGQLSQAGYTRMRNAVLAKAYGDSPVLQRMVESLDSNVRNVGAALMRVAPQVAKTREAIGEGALFEADITPDLMAAVEELAALKERGAAVSEALAQTAMFGDKLSAEARELLAFLDQNARSPRRMAEFIQAYLDALAASGNPAQGSMFGDAAEPSKTDLMAAARRTTDDDARPRGPVAGDPAIAQKGRSQSEGTQSRAAGAGGDETPGEWLAFAPDSGTLGIPRAAMPQIRGEHRGALVQFLAGQGIGHEVVELPAAQLKPTQAEYSAKKVAKWQERRDDGDRSVLASKDGYILDGHHQWVAAREAGESEKVIRFDAPIRDLLAAAFRFPSVQRSTGADGKLSAAADSADMRAALADLARIAATHVGPVAPAGTRLSRAAKPGPLARMVRADMPGLMPALVKVFRASITRVGYDSRELMREVKARLKADPELRQFWNRIGDDLYRQAAQQAIEQESAARVDDLFAARDEGSAQADLFAISEQRMEGKSASENNEAGTVGAAKRTMVIDGNEYDAQADNFGLPPWPETLPADSPLLIDSRQHAMGAWNGAPVTRRRMHDEIVRDFFVDAVPPKDRRPIVSVMGGGGAAGKGWIRNELVKAGKINLDGAVVLDPDDIKALLPEYQQILDAGDSRGAETVHEESSQLAKRILDKSVAGQYDLVYDVTLGTPEKSMALLQRFKEAGYEVRLFGVTVDPAAAVIRADSRARGNFRYVPITELLKAHKGFMAGFERYAHIADEAVLFENTDGIRTLAATDLAGNLEIVKPEEYDEAVRRAESINEQATNLAGITGDAATGPNAGANQGIRRSAEGRIARSESASARKAVRERSGSGDGGLRADSDQTKDVGVRGGIQQSGHGGRDAELERDRGYVERGASATSAEAARSDNGTTGAAESFARGDGGLNERDGASGAGRAEGQGATTAPRPGRQRQAEQLRAGQGSGDLFADDQPGAPNGESVRLRQDGRSDGAGQDHERRDPAGEGSRARRATGIPAGRDIPTKSGRNYRFGDGDLTYEGGWQKKAAQNVEAVELAKRLETEGRQATREEQAVLAKFIGWGASEIRNAIFGKKLDADARAIGQYEDALQSIKDAGGSMSRYASGYMQAHYLLAGANVSGYRYGDPITTDILAKAKPDMAAKKWIELRNRLKAALSAEEWATAERSTQYAHYTSKAVVRAMWKAVERMGFKGGAILEPGAGIGVFPGLMDAALATNSAYTGIEYDALTGAILKQLLPDERILVESFVDTALPDNFYDMAIGNPPFANVKILSDPKYKKHAFSLHDYFFAKSVDKVKPGGLMVYVTSRYTMDKQGDKARKYLAERADLVGAIRLPQTAFMKNAGTEVVTDVLFLRKRMGDEALRRTSSGLYLMKTGDRQEVVGEPVLQLSDWTGVQEVQTAEGPALINEYFAAHPEMVLGTHSLRGSMYAKNEYTVLPREGDIEALFAAAVENLPANIYRATGAAAQAAQVREIDFNPKAQKEGNYYVTDAGVLMQREGGVGVRVETKPEKTVALLKDFVRLRDALKQAHYDQLNDGPWEDSLRTLQKEYRGFVKKHGRILQNKAFERATRREDEETGQEIEDLVTWRRFDLLNKISDDPDYTLVAELERLNEESGEIVESAFLRERVLAKPVAARIETPHDALLAVLNDSGKVDLPTIAERLGLTETEAAAALGTAIYESPSTGWQMADAYLSGNVKQKLREAREAARADRRFERNVEALLSVQPSPVPPSDITAAIGMNWIPAQTYAQFLNEKAGIRATIDYNERTGQWTVTAHSGFQTTTATVDWGTPERNAAEILDHALTGRPIRVTRSEGTGNDKKAVFDSVATEAANQKLAQMRGAFSEWLWQDGTRADTLTQRYNDRFNTIVARKFDGRHLTLPGSTTTIKVFDHVKRGAWRIIQAGNTYLAHAVGSGKTWQMVISAMEQKRLGLIQKPMMVVPNHMLQQFAREWQQLYPAARLMVADEKQFHTENRRRFVSRVAMSDLDGVIITHSAFKLLDLDPEFKRGMIEEQLDYLRAALEEAGGEEGKKSRDPKVRDIQNRIEKMEQKLEAAMSSTGKDKNVRFDQLGVDMLYVDEAHEFRKLAFTTQRQVKGIDSSGSDRAFDLYMKTRWLEQKNPGRSLVMASGTPVTNTLAELYSVQRFMAPQVLEDRGLADFDSWAAMFGQENTEIEADASGRYAPVTRFTKFVNVPELTQMFREYADVLTSDHLAEMLGDKRPRVRDGSRKLVITPQTDDYAAFKQELSARLTESRAWKPSKDEPNNPDPIIKIIGDGRLAAIDMRFIDPSLPADPESKLNQLADGVIEVYKRTADKVYVGKDGQPEAAKGGAQMVFSDLGFGAGVAEHRGFNARAWFEKRLRDAGIPPAQVAFMSDYKKSTAKLKLFQDVNAGRVRILVGSSKNMGTGVNAQQRLVALHHLDTPWYPADLEQREGRIIRQGNKNPLVEIYAYSTKGSYDTVMWQMLASKQRFIDQALSGDSSVRSIDDLTEASQFQIATAMTAGDPRAIQLAGLKADIEKLQRLFRAHEETRMRLRSDYDLAGSWIESAERQLPAAEKLAGQVANLAGENFQAKADGKRFDKRKEWGEALLALLKDYAARGKDGRLPVGTISGFPVEFVGQIVRDTSGNIKEYRSGLSMQLGDASYALAHDPGEDPVGMAIRATNLLSAAARKPAELRQRIADSKAKRAALVDRLDARFQFAGELADKLREAEALEAAMIADQAQASAPADASQLSRGVGRGMALRDLQAVADRVAKGFKNLPRVHVLESPAALSTRDPSQKALREFIRRAGAWHDVEGATHDGEIFLFATGMADEARAEHVLATHEITHHGLAGTLGKDLDAALQQIYLFNDAVRAAADEMKIARDLESNVEAVEEVLADMPSADLVKLRSWRRVVHAVRNWLRRSGAVRLAARLDRWLQAGLSSQQKADLFVADIVTAARDWVRTGKGGPAKASAVGETRLAEQKLADDWAEQEKWLDKEARLRGYRDIDDLATKAYPVFERLAAQWRKRHPVEKALLSRAPSSPKSGEDGFAAQPAGTAKPLDAIAKGVTQALRIDRLTAAAYDKASALIDRYTPETLKAGLVSDYGIPEAVIDRRAVMEGRQRQQLRGAGALLEKLATLTRAESRVAYEWMNNADPQAADYFERQLPPESVQVLKEIKALIDTLSQEAVKLGQLDAEAFKRNRYAYLHRSYAKHTAELSRGDTARRARAIAILGDQYKGRGMTDAVDMRRVQNVAPEWWNRKLQAGKADKQLRGEQFIRLERRAHSGEGTPALPGIGDRGRGRLQEVAYWPAAEPVPSRFAAWDRAGTWEVRDARGGQVIIWRDFTRQEREAMGEIDEARYAIAKTLHGMIHDIETGRYLEWLGQNYAKKEGETISGQVVEASERMRDTFKPGEWVKVPATTIPGTKVKKYGILADRYLPGPIWNDVRQILGGRFKPLGETYAAIHSAWKTSKTALSPAVHMNNVMANFIMADWHDITAGHILKALRLTLSKDPAATAMLERFGDAGGTIGTWATKELQQEQLRPLLDALEKELGLAGEAVGQVGVLTALQLALRGRFPSAWEALKSTKTGQAGVKAARAMLDLYEAEDQVFRLAAWLKAKEDGADDLAAGKVARKSFLDYSINAPWVQMMRATAFPFIAFTYRSVPMLLDTAAHKPWKLLKLGLVAGMLNAMGYLLSGGDEDDERKLLPEEKAGRIWGLAPKLMRMPWNDEHGSPVFLDVRRWIPVGDIFDTGQGHAAVPMLPSLVPSGPLALLAELGLNKVQFTGREITLETDTAVEKAAKVADHLYKAFMPNLAVVPGTYAWTGIANAGKGKTDAFGREQSLTQAIVSSVGIKLGSYPQDVLRQNALREAQAKTMEIDRNVTALKREYQKRGLSDEEFRDKVAVQQEKRRRVVAEFQRRAGGG